MLKLAPEELFKQIRTISSEADLNQWDHRRPAISWSNWDRWTTLYGESASAYWGLLSEIESALGGRLSLETIESYIRRAITTEAYAQSSGIGRTHLNDLFTLYEKSIFPQTVYLPIDGIDLEIPRFHIGRVRFVRFDERHRAEVLSKAIEAADSIENEEFREEHVRQWERNLENRLVGKVCSITHSAAEPKRAVELAYLETLRAIEAITFGQIALYPFHPVGDAVIAIEGQKPGVLPWTISKSESGIWYQQKSPPQHWNATISELSLQQMSMCGLGEISRILLEPAPTDFQSAILNSVHWLWESTRNSDPAGKATCLFVALESLVSDQLYSPTKEKISKGISRILSHPLRSIEADQEELLRLWRLRSKAVHGYRSSLGADDLLLLRTFVVQSITQLLHYVDEIESLEELSPHLKPDRETDCYLGNLTPRSLAPVHGCGPSTRFLRFQAGASAEQFESMTDGLVSAERLRHWESAAATVPFNDLLRIAEALQVDLDEFDLHCSDRLVKIHGLVFLLHCHSTQEGGTARIHGLKFDEATTELELATTVSGYGGEPISYALEWEEQGNGCQDALDKLERTLRDSIQPVTSSCG